MNTLDCLIDYVSNWRSLNGVTYSGKLRTDDYIKFARDLQNEIAKEILKTLKIIFFKQTHIINLPIKMYRDKSRKNISGRAFTKISKG